MTKIRQFLGWACVLAMSGTEAFACEEYQALVSGNISREQPLTSDYNDSRVDAGNKDSATVAFDLAEAGLGDNRTELLFRRVDKHRWRIDAINDTAAVPRDRRQMLGPIATIEFNDDGDQLGTVIMRLRPATQSGERDGSVLSIAIRGLKLGNDPADIRSSVQVIRNVECSRDGEILRSQSEASPTIRNELNPIVENPELGFLLK